MSKKYVIKDEVVKQIGKYLNQEQKDDIYRFLTCSECKYAQRDIEHCLMCTFRDSECGDTIPWLVQDDDYCSYAEPIPTDLFVVNLTHLEEDIKNINDYKVDVIVRTDEGVVDKYHNLNLKLLSQVQNGEDEWKQ